MHMSSSLGFSLLNALTMNAKRIVLHFGFGINLKTIHIQ